MDDSTTIHCSRCDTDLPVDAFSPSNRKNGDWCRACRKRYMQQYHLTHKPWQRTPSTPRLCRNDGCEAPARPRSQLCDATGETKPRSLLANNDGARSAPACSRPATHASATAPPNAEASVWRGGYHGPALIQGPVLPTDVLLLDNEGPCCPDCGEPTHVVTDTGDYGCQRCYVKITLI